MGPGEPRSAGSLSRTLTYALRWLVAGAAVAVVVIALLGGGRSSRPREAGVLPPVQEITLLDAVRQSDCRLRRLQPGSPLALVDPRTGAAPPGTYRASLTAPALGAALRRGIIVIQYHPRVPRDVVDRLVAIQGAVPRGTIVAPLGVPRADALVVAAYGRVMRCPRASAAALNALRLFRGRFVGIGPQR